MYLLIQTPISGPITAFLLQYGGAKQKIATTSINRGTASLQAPFPSPILQSRELATTMSHSANPQHTSKQVGKAHYERVSVLSSECVSN